MQRWQSREIQPCSFQHRHCRRSVAGVLLPSRDTIVNMLTSNSVIRRPRGAPTSERTGVAVENRCRFRSGNRQARRELVALEDHVSARLDQGRVLLVGTDSLSRTGQKVARSGTAPRRLARCRILATPEMIIRAGELRRQTNAEVPLPTDPVARAIVAAGKSAAPRPTMCRFLKIVSLVASF